VAQHKRCDGIAGAAQATAFLDRAHGELEPILADTIEHARHVGRGLSGGSASKAGPRPFRPQVIGTKRLSQIGWGLRSAPISTTIAAFGTIFEYVSTSR